MKIKKSVKRIITLVMASALFLGVEPLSYAEKSTETEEKSFVWRGKDGLAHVDTGLGNGTEGIWWIEDDNADGGQSEVIFDHADPNNHSNTVSDEDIKQFKGISGTIKLDEGELDYKPLVSICFDIVGVNDANEKITGDATGWGGLSVYYECDAPATLELSLDNETNHDMGYAYPEVSLPKTNGESAVKSFTWAQFKQPGWAVGTSVTGEEAATKLASIKFTVQGNPGEYHFNIKGIGSKNEILDLDNYTITYNLNGGTNATENPDTYDILTSTFTLSDPVKSGYEFAGWYSDEAFQTVANTTITSGSTGNKTFYAKWEKSLTNPDIVIEGISKMIYAGNPFKPAVVVKDGTKTLLENIDYTVSFWKNGNIVTEITGVGNYDVIIEGKGEYCGTVTQELEVVDNASAATEEPGETPPTSTGEPIVPPEVKPTQTPGGNLVPTPTQAPGAINPSSTGSAVTAGAVNATTNEKQEQKITYKKVKTYKAKDLKKKEAKFSLKAKTTGDGKLTYKVTKGKSKYIAVKKSGKVILKKNCKKGTYKIKIKASETDKYKEAKVIVKIKVK